jgi:hypothetical protein
LQNDASAADGDPVPGVRLNNKLKLHVSPPLKRSLDNAGIRQAATVAQVSDLRGDPALALIVEGDLVLVSGRGALRWKPHELERLEQGKIIAGTGAPVPIGAWWFAAERDAFLRTVGTLLAQPDVEESLPVSATSGPPALGIGRLVTIIALLLGVIAVLGAAALIGRGDWIWIFVLVTILSAAPLSVASIKLYGRPSQWQWLGIVGIALGSVATLAFVLFVLALVAFSAACGGGGCLS